MVKFGAQLTIFAAISGLSYAVNRWEQHWFATPATMSDEVKRSELEKFHFPGDKREFVDFNYSKNSRVAWPKWDRRDDPEDNRYHLHGASSNEDEE